ncbi:alpha/beta fold hydrolase [Bailinhaonella thermotolerans]|uniref:Alpha/beta fold hydrolase n=1 Tax=Bailinhaonella thermotolerans TaxID=1070861 RepID=A0A3A4AYT2_9ACTN|nr:alpha/beta hydrolase [Bailinhaonella thermotolerans]RJL24522.1 alpha/beta fold hydrolase [Bailinhaonella thermotolerans]
MQLYSRTVGSGTPVVLLHAFPLSSAMWLAQREGLAASCQVITPDLRGFGGSRLGDDEPSIDHMADDVAALLDAEGVPRAVVGGQSLGAHVALALAARHPAKVAGLILSGATAEPDPPEAREERERLAQAVLDKGSAVLLDEYLPRLLGRTTRQRRALVQGRVRGLVQAAPPGAVAWALRALAARPGYADVLRGLGVPVLVLTGDEDAATPEGAARELAGLASDGRLTVIEKAGQLSAVEQPELFNQAVEGFLKHIE